MWLCMHVLTARGEGLCDVVNAMTELSYHCNM